MIKIILADDHPIVRDGFKALLEKQPSFEVVGVAQDGRETVQLVKTHRVDVVIMDVNMPNLSGIEATRQIKAYAPDVKIIALSIHTESEFVAQMIQAGASGYIPKSSVAKELIEAIRTVMSDRTYLSPKVADAIVAHLQRISGKPSSEGESLTPREKEVLQLIAEGKTSKEISTLLNVSDHTVETHRKRIMKKLNINTIAGLTKYAISHGLTSLEY